MLAITSRNLYEKIIQIRLPVNSRYNDWITIFETLIKGPKIYTN